MKIKDYKYSYANEIINGMKSMFSGDIDGDYDYEYDDDEEV